MYWKVVFSIRHATVSFRIRRTTRKLGRSPHAAISRRSRSGNYYVLLSFQEEPPRQYQYLSEAVCASLGVATVVKLERERRKPPYLYRSLNRAAIRTAFVLHSTRKTERHRTEYCHNEASHMTAHQAGTDDAHEAPPQSHQMSRSW